MSAATATVPFFCADCESELTGEAHRQPDGRYICGTCKEKLRQKAESKKQGGLFEEQKTLFNPARKRNVEGFRDANGVFHPIRASKDYNEFLAGDFEPTKRELSKREREQKEWERKELRAVTGASGLPKRSLASFVRSIGGMTPGGMFAGEVKRLSSTQTGTTGLINKRARQGSQKQTPEYVMDAANQEGYRDAKGAPYQEIGAFLLAVESSAIKGVSKTRRRGPTKKQRDAKILAKAFQRLNQRAKQARGGRLCESVLLKAIERKAKPLRRQKLD